MSEIKFIYYDIGNVLLLFSGGLQKLANKYDKEYSDFERVFKKYDDLICRGQITPKNLWTHYQNELEFDGEDFDFAEFWASNFVLIHESFDLINEINRSEVKIGLLSNIYPQTFDILANKNFFPFNDWDSKVLSCETGFVKPEEAIYKIAEQKAGIDPNEILFVDDKLEFLKPASKRGWRTFQFDHSKISESVGELRHLLVKKKVLT